MRRWRGERGGVEEGGGCRGRRARRRTRKIDKENHTDRETDTGAVEVICGRSARKGERSKIHLCQRA